MSVSPVQIEQVDTRTLRVRWSDEHESRYDATELRKACPCAACLEIQEGERKMRILPAMAPGSVMLDDVKSVGRYAIQLKFSDGHATGIYAYDYLRSLCHCCQNRGQSTSDK